MSQPKATGSVVIAQTAQINMVTMSDMKKVEISRNSHNKQPQSILTLLHQNVIYRNSMLPTKKKKPTCQPAAFSWTSAFVNKAAELTHCCTGTSHLSTRSFTGCNNWGNNCTEHQPLWDSQRGSLSLFGIGFRQKVHTDRFNLTVHIRVCVCV